MITVNNLVFEYPNLRALDNVSFAIEPNTVTALIGPNGAGKTTLMRCVAALDVPLSGVIEIDGLDVERHPRDVHARMGFLYDFYGLYDELSVAQSLTHRAGAQGVASDERPARVARDEGLLPGRQRGKDGLAQADQFLLKSGAFAFEGCR